MGIAVAIENGLLNVVAKDADQTPLTVMAQHNAEMINGAREGKVRPEDVEGETIAVSNLGAYDVDHFVAIINPPSAAIVAVGSAAQQPIVLEDGTLGVGWRMKATVSADHRVTDGAKRRRICSASRDSARSAALVDVTRRYRRLHRLCHAPMQPFSCYTHNDETILAYTILAPDYLS